MSTLCSLPAEIRKSPLGWYGVAGTETAVCGVTIGHTTEAEAELRLAELLAESECEPSSLVRDAAEEIARYLAGEPVDLNAIPVQSTATTPFQRRVKAQLRKVGYGQTVSYAELALRGSTGGSTGGGIGYVAQSGAAAGPVPSRGRYGRQAGWLLGPARVAVQAGVVVNGSAARRTGFPTCPCDLRLLLRVAESMSIQSCDKSQQSKSAATSRGRPRALRCVVAIERGKSWGTMTARVAIGYAWRWSLAAVCSCRVASGVPTRRVPHPCGGRSSQFTAPRRRMRRLRSIN